MRKRRTGARGELEAALAALRDALEEAGVPWAVIGGIAVIAHGVARVTADIDAVVRGDAITAEELSAVLARHGIVPRIGQAAELARAGLVLVAKHRATGIGVDVSFGWTRFELEVVAKPSPVRVRSVKIPMASPEQLVVFKAIARRPKDVQDAEELLALYPTIRLARVRARVAELAELADDPSIVIDLEQMIASARQVARRTRKRPK